MTAQPFRPISAPLYRQVEEHLARQICDGVYAPGALLPSDAQLCEMYRVSRATVRSAIDRLVSANLVRRQQGVGTFVLGADHGIQTARLIGYIEGIHPYMNFSMLESGRVAMPASVAAGMGVDAGTPCQCFVGVNHIGEKPLSFLEDYYPDDVASFINESDFLGLVPPIRIVEMRSGRRFSHATQRIDAVAAPDRVARALDLTAGQPVIRMERIYFAADTSILDFAVAHYHPERYQFEIKIVPRTGQHRREGVSAEPFDDRRTVSQTGE
ncbi:MAG: GntR family transcriptional regulator [Lautropia sp.]